jgi:hypothetical protein
MFQNACRDSILGVASFRDFDVEDACDGFNIRVAQPGVAAKGKNAR